MTTHPLMTGLGVAMLAATLVANAAASPTTSVEGHADIPAFAAIVVPVDRSDVSPYVPAGFRTVEAGDETSITLGLALFEDTSFVFENGTSHQDALFAYSDLKMGTYGPEGGGFDSGGVLNLWRLAGSPIFPEALARLGVGCGGGEPPQTRFCHVPQLMVTMEPTTTGIDIHASVPWGFSPYSASASFVPTTLPCAVCLPIEGWHAGARGLVRESVVWSVFPGSAIIGVGTGTVRAATGSPLFHILGDRTEATAPAVLFRGHADAVFTLQ